MSNKFGYFPKSEEDLNRYIEEIENKQHDYNSIAEALRDATLAFFNYFAVKHAMTGWQSSWAALSFLGKSRGLEAPFMIVDSSKLLFPQYDVLGDVKKFIEDSKKDLAGLAKEKLNKVDGLTSPNVVARWEELASYEEVVK